MWYQSVAGGWSTGQHRPPRGSRRDLLMRAAVPVARHEQAVPMDRDRHLGAVDDGRGHFGARTDADDRAEIRLVEAKGERRCAGDELGFAGHRRDLEGAARGRIDHRKRNRERGPGGPGAATDQTRHGKAKGGGSGGLQELASVLSHGLPFGATGRARCAFAGADLKPRPSIRSDLRPAGRSGTTARGWLLRPWPQPTTPTIISVWSLAR